MMKFEEVQALVVDTINSYEEGWNEVNKPEYSIKFNLTVSHHKVPDDKGKKANVAYLRLDRVVKDKEDKVINSYLIYHNTYKFKNLGEVTDKKWKTQMYLNLLVSLISGGIEYAEISNRLQEIKQNEEKAEEAKNEKTKLDLDITSEMPADLKPDEQEYKEWVKKNHEGTT